MRVLVVDDDLKSCDFIKNEIERDFENVIVECYDFLPDIENLSNDYDVIFLDIFVNNQSGIDYAKQLKKRFIKPVIVFISNKRELIFQTQEISPLCFIRKSEFDYDYAVFKCLFEEKIREKKVYTFDLNKTVNKKKVSQIKLKLDDIIYVECYMHELIIHTHFEEYVAKMTMKKFLNMIKGENCFIQIHRSYAINMNYIYSIENNNVCMINGRNHNILEIGRTYKKNFKNKFQKFLL